MPQFQFTAASESETSLLGRLLAESIAHADTGLAIALSGTLGAGKTRLVQAMGQAWGYDPRDIVSPTFTICVEHRGEFPFQHADVYRIESLDQWFELGLDERIDDGEVVIIEWAEKVAAALPGDRLQIQIELSESTDHRVFTMTSSGSQSDLILSNVRSKFDGIAGPTP